MYREPYHLVAVHAPPPDAESADRLHAYLANARASFLQQLGLTSARLLANGMRLGVAPGSAVRPANATVFEAVGVALRLESVSHTVAFSETLYDVGDYWTPFWWGTTQVWAEVHGAVAALPSDLHHELAAWLHLSRGSVPVPGNQRGRRSAV